MDGQIGHEGEGRFRDMNRDNRHALLDETTLRYGYFDVSSRPWLAVCGDADAPARAVGLAPLMSGR